MKKVIVELRTQAGWTRESVIQMAAALPGFQIDDSYEPVPAAPSEELASALGSREEAVVIRGMVQEEKEEELKGAPTVIAVWQEGRIEPI